MARPEPDIALDEAALLVAAHAHPDLDVDARLAQHHAATRFRPQFLMPVGPRAILQRVLGNLQHTYMQRDPKAVVWVVRLRLRIPGLTLSQRGDLAGVLGRLGQFAEAARELDVLAELLPGEGGEQAKAAAASLRARA